MDEKHMWKRFNSISYHVKESSKSYSVDCKEPKKLNDIEDCNKVKNAFENIK